MSRFVAAVVTFVDGLVKATVDPRLAVSPRNASVELAVGMATARQDRRDRAGIEAVKRAGREAWSKHHGGTP